MARLAACALLLGWTIAAGALSGCGGGTTGPAPATSGDGGAGGPCVTTRAGSGEFGTQDGMAAQARFFMPHAVAVDGSAQVHVADYGSSNRTRLVAGGIVFTLEEDAIDFPQPHDTATDAEGNRYVADLYGNRILKITPAGETSVLAGTGESGDRDGGGAFATFSLPAGLAFDGDGALYVADMGNRKIRRIKLAAAR
jgi:DNA-binding beta-propeller fold protein YncE